VLVIGNFNLKPQILKLSELRTHDFFLHESMKDLCTGTRLQAENDAILIPPLSHYWLSD
jgi:hypothetical protein